MRRLHALLPGIVLALLLAGCAGNLTNQRKIVDVYRKHEAAFLAAVASGDYSTVEKLRGVREVTTRGENGEIEFCCGGRGLAPASSYFGILYVPGAAGKPYAQVFGDGPEWTADGAGCRYRQDGGDNEFYYEALGNGFYYYEEHY